MPILSDEELKRLAGKLTPEQIDALSDDEVNRLHAISNQADAGLVGKPTLAESEQQKVTPQESVVGSRKFKALAETPVVRQPQYPGQVPDLPSEGPKDLKSFLAGIGEAATGGASRMKDPPVTTARVPAADAELNNPTTVMERIRKQQNDLISSNQSVGPFSGAATMSLKDSDFLTKSMGQAAYGAVRGITESTSQFLLDPATQLKDHPAEFAMNALVPAIELGLLGTAGKALKTFNSGKGIIGTEPVLGALGVGTTAAGVTLATGGDKKEAGKSFVAGALAGAAGGQFVREMKGFTKAIAEVDANLAKIPGAVRAAEADILAGAGPDFATPISVQDTIESRVHAVDRRKLGIEREQIDDLYESVNDAVGDKHRSASSKDAAIYEEIDRRLEAGDITGPQETVLKRMQYEKYLKEQPPPSGDYEPPPFIPESTASDEAINALDRKMSDAALGRPVLPREDAAKAALESAPPEQLAAAREVIESKLDDIEKAKNLHREVGGEPETLESLRASQAALEKSSEAIDEAGRNHGAIDDWERRYRAVSQETALAEKNINQPMLPEDIDLWRKDWKAFSRKAGYTEEEIAAEQKRLDMVEEGQRLGLSRDDISAIDHEVNQDLQRTASPPSPAVASHITTSDGITWTPAGEITGGKKGPIQMWQADQPVTSGGRVYPPGRAMTEDGIRAAGLQTPSEARAAGEAPKALPPTEVSGATDTARASVKLPEVLSATPVGLALLVGAAKDDKTDPAPRAEGSPLAIRHALWAVAGGALAYGAFRYFKAADWAAIGADVKNVTSMEGKFGARGKQTADFEKFAKDVLAPLFPDTPANGKIQNVVAAGTYAGAAVGGAVGSQAGRDEISVPGLLAGAVVGGMMGAHLGRGLSKMFATDRTFRQLYVDWMTEGAGMSESAVAAKKAARVATEGRIREIADVTKAAAKLPPESQSKMQAYMSGNMNADNLTKTELWHAEKMRFIFDSLTLDMLSSGLIEDDVLRATYESNLGSYVPRLMLRYELDSHPREIVQAWARSQGTSVGQLTAMDYNKLKNMNIPEDVLKSLGEIKDSPSYLLAKRGVQVAADVEAARYHKFILSSPENAVPDVVLERGLEAKKAYDKLRREDYLANKAKTLTDKQNVGEIPETNYSPEIAREEQAKAAAKLYDHTITLADEYLAPHSPHPRFFTKSSDGLEAAQWQGRTYWKMPDNKRYGLLKGKYVEQAVASDVMGMHDTASGLAGLYTAPLSSFKFFKAVANPGSLLRNGVTNVILADLEAGIGFGPWNWSKWVRGYNDVRTGNAMYLRARKAGTFGGEFTKAEQLAFLEPHIGKAENAMDLIGRVIPDYAEKGGAKFAKAHQATEAHARMTVFRHAVESLGMDDASASAFSRRTIPDYQDVPRWIKVVRNNPFGAPFVSFSYKALPRSLEAATAFGNPKKMMSFWKYPFAMAALAEYGAQKFGLLGKDEKTDVFGSVKRILARGLSGGTYSPDSYDTYRKYLPNHVGNMQITIPWRDQYDRPQYLDGTFFLPWGDAGEMGKGDIGQKSGIPFLPRQIEPSNPWFQLGVAATTGKDNFTGKDIIPAGAVGMEQVAAMGQFLMRSWGPSLTPGAGYGAEDLKKSFGAGLTSDPNTKAPMEAVAADILGARARPVDPKSSFRFRAYDLKDKLDKNESELRKLSRSYQGDEPLTHDVLMNMIKNRPSSALARAARRRLELIDDFKKKYPRADLPPSPEKLLEAIQMQRAH